MSEPELEMIQKSICKMFIFISHINIKDVLHFHFLISVGNTQCSVSIQLSVYIIFFSVSAYLYPLFFSNDNPNDIRILLVVHSMLHLTIILEFY